MKKGKKLLSVFLVIIMLFYVVPVFARAAVYDGYCSEYKYSDVKWKLNTNTGELVISGTGYMRNPNLYTPAWEDYLEDIKTVVIKEGIKGISYAAFEDCINLTSVSFPDSLEVIEDYAFLRCEKLAEIDLPSGIKNFGGAVFSDTAYYNDSSNWENGVLYIENYLVDVDDSLGDKLVIKNGTTTIARWAVSNANVFDIVIPDSVKYICDDAFHTLKNVVSISIPDSVVSIGDGAFQLCKELKYITLTDSVKHIGSLAFYATAYYDDSKNWDNGVLYIGKNLVGTDNSIVSGDYKIKEGTINTCKQAFWCCRELETVFIPESVKNIDGGIFAKCDALKEITIDPDNQYYTVENNVLFSKDKTSLVAYPIGLPDTSYTVPDTVEKIVDYAFYGSENLTSLNVPVSVKDFCHMSIYLSQIRDIYYMGSKSQWEKVETDGFFQDVTVHYGDASNDNNDDNNDLNFFEKILEFLKDILDKIKQLFGM